MKQALVTKIDFCFKGHYSNMTKNDVGRRPEIHLCRKLRKTNSSVYSVKNIRRMIVCSERIYILFMISKSIVLEIKKLRFKDNAIIFQLRV